MSFRQYVIGCRLFGVALGLSMIITLLMPSFDIVSVGTTETGLHKALSGGYLTGFIVEDPLLKNDAVRPKVVTLNKDPKTGAKIDPITAYVYTPGVRFPSAINHPRTMGKTVQDISVSKGQIEMANVGQGAVFTIGHVERDGEVIPYARNESALNGWQPQAVLDAAGDANTHHVSYGKTIFVREGCWWCHTLLPEQTQDWQYFGRPPLLGDFNSESPTTFGSDRKAPDLLHVGSRNSSREWMMMHFFNPRLVQPHSIMPRFNYLWGKEDIKGNKIDLNQWQQQYAAYMEGKKVYAPEVPEYRRDADIRSLIDFILSLK